MKIGFKALLCSFGLQALVALSAHAASPEQSFALKSGESVEVTDLYWVLNCKSQLIGLPDATILDGPSQVKVKVVEADVLPRYQQCAKPVKGAKLILEAGQVEEESNTQMTLRILYKTKDGTRQRSLTVSIALFP